MTSSTFIITSPASSLLAQPLLCVSIPSFPHDMQTCSFLNDIWCQNKTVSPTVVVFQWHSCVFMSQLISFHDQG